MKVLLISANTEQFNMPAMPLGLACVAEAVRDAGHDVSLLDLMFEMDVTDTIQNIVNTFQPECFGISVRNIDDQNIATPQFLLEKVRGIVAVCRDLSNAPIVLGGAGYSMFPDSSLTYLDADFGIEGEGEIAFPALLKCLENYENPTRIQGLYIRGQGLQQPKSLCSNLDQLTLPDTSILSASASQNNEPWIPVQTRRGCALKCSYCSTASIEGTILRKRSPERVAAWLEKWVKCGYANFFFVDNTFNLPPAYAKSICRQILDKKLDMHWRCIVYPKSVDDELVKLMAKAGCRQISLGCESGSLPILKNLNKQFTLEEVRTTSALFARYGIERMGFLLLGGPGETKTSVEESLAFADSLKLDSLRLTAGIRIYPDTQLAVTAMGEGVITSTSNLLYPHFYLSKELEGWLPEKLERWRASRPNIIY
ncbi:MAG: B12-binding domain-containing radical SAM protein [Desulforhopalus sp.]